MTLASTIALVAFASLAGSYGWGMRGTKIGGEKGALLPGAFLGLIFAWFSGSDILRENFWIPTAAGALGMFFGGTETYGQTLGFIVKSRPPENYKKGMYGVLLKGALWFGIFGAIIGMSFTAMTGSVYAPSDIILFFAVMFPLRYLGILLFNHPHRPKEKKFPKIYFSVDRHEEWGGLLFLLIGLIVLMTLRADTYALWFSLSGAVSGALGWALGINLFYLVNHPLKSGRYLMGKLQKNGFIGGWKIMEFTLGAVGGLGTALYFCLNFDALGDIANIIQANGGVWNPLGERADLYAWIALGLIMITSLQYLFQSEYRKKVKPGSKTDLLGKGFELLEQPFYSYIPLVLILLGGVKMAQIVAFFVLFWVSVQKDFFERFMAAKNRFLWLVILVGGAVAVLVGEILLPSSYSAWQAWLMYCVLYELFELFWLFRPEVLKELRASGKVFRRMSEPLVHGWFLLQIAVLLVVGAFVFR